MNIRIANKLGKTVGVMCSLLLLASCSDWDDHYDDNGISNADVEIYNGDIASYINNNESLTEMARLYNQNGIFESTTPDGNYTFIVAENSAFEAQKEEITDEARWARHTVADASIAPSLLTDGYGIQTRSGKSVWVYGNGQQAKLDDYNILKTVKTANGYVYVIDGLLPVRQSIYEYLTALPEEEYSEFKAMVKSYEEKWFDREASRVLGVNEQGMTVYDSVFVNRNTLMDRYTEDGVEKWNMRDENYQTTMFVPDNNQVKEAMKAALDSIPKWLNRQPTVDDTLKFKAWIVKACFVDRSIPTETLTTRGDEQFECVGGCQMVEDKLNDIVSYKDVAPAYWRPSVNTVNTASKVALSNGTAYLTTNLHIPNHIVIYRVKSRFYELWNSMNAEMRKAHFLWTNWQNPMVLNEAQGPYTLSENLPTMYYNVLTAEPTQEACDENLVCSVVYDGLTYDENNDAIYEVNLPAGEYYLRMGFKHSLTYSLSIYFKGADEDDSQYVELKKDMVMYATGSNFHFDRGAASEVPHYGEDGIAYPENFDVDYWQTIDEKAIAYDTDGYTVGIVKLKKNGNFKIKVSSSDLAKNYSYNIGDASARTKTNVQQLMMYHWCLRPTYNNY